MSIVLIVVTFLVASTFLWLINNYIAPQGKLKTILNLVIVILVLLSLLRVFAVAGYL